MQKEDQIIEMLEQIIGKFDEHSFDNQGAKPVGPEDNSIMAAEIEILRKEVWQNSVDIRRIKNILGMN